MMHSVAEQVELIIARLSIYADSNENIEIKEDLKTKLLECQVLARKIYK